MRPAAAPQVLPRRMNVERTLLEGLKHGGPTNYLGAYSRLSRALKSMYQHAFQSYLWNHAASERVRLYGVERAVEGDLVLPAGADAAEWAAEGGEGQRWRGRGTQLTSRRGARSERRRRGRV